MIIYNKNTKRKAGFLYSSVYLIFLFISIFHTHHFTISVSPLSEINSEQNIALNDLLLDSSLTCTINTFNKTIKFDKTGTYQEAVLAHETLKNYFFSFYFPAKLNTSNFLRAPPKNLV
jgi:hypothetical protein